MHEEVIYTKQIRYSRTHPDVLMEVRAVEAAVVPTRLVRHVADDRQAKMSVRFLRDATRPFWLQYDTVLGLKNGTEAGRLRVVTGFLWEEGRGVVVALREHGDPRTVKRSLNWVAKYFIEVDPWDRIPPKEIV